MTGTRIAGSGVATLVAFGLWCALAAGAEATQATARAFDISIARGRVPDSQRALRVSEGERVELRWSADELLVLHLHGYDIETRVAPGKPAVTAFTARLTGRFPVEIHAAGSPEQGGGGGSRHRHLTLLYVEVHPR